LSASTDLRQLAELRSRAGLSQQDLAGLLGVTPAAVSNWERGQSRPRGRVLSRLVAVVGGGVIPAQAAPSHSIWTVEGTELEPAPYVTNGPEDQHEFYRGLVAMQLAGLQHNPSLDPRALSVVSKFRNGQWQPTFQGGLEKPTANARAWRGTYGLHGIHRYVGRFPPHVVRALLVGFGLERGSLVLDPFLGSGTTTLESRLLGFRSHGIEINPLSALISRCKSEFPESTDSILKVANDFGAFYDDRFEAFIAGHPSSCSTDDVLQRAGNIVEPFTNIERWFIPEALLGVSITLEFARTLEGFERDLMHVSLSAQMRSIGNVDVDVVRAEYRKTPRAKVDVRALVTRALHKSATEIEHQLATHKDVIAGPDSVVIELASVLSEAGPADGTVDAIITSPPYGVESLSYLRTHLLSYRVMSKELGMDAYDWNDGAIGSEYLGGADLDPYSLTVAHESETFRKFFGAMPDSPTGNDLKRIDMMMQFFEDMSAVTARMSVWLKRGRPLAFVVGNKSLLGQIIPTDQIMREIFEAKGLAFDRAITHKLKTNNSNSSVPWQDRIIAEENIMLATKR
jgi:transcriptional regulator with XRE-family HTH domain